MLRLAIAAVCCLAVTAWAFAQPGLTEGLVPHQVIQVQADDTASLTLVGDGGTGSVEVRWQPGGDWQALGNARNGEWSGTIEGIPVGGPYTLELRNADAPDAVSAMGPFFCGDLWVLAGQSNMQGVGNNLAVTPPHERVMVFAMNDEWRPASEPLHRLPEAIDVVHNRDEQRTELPGPAVEVSGWTKGAGLGLAFATAVTEATERPIGLIANAHGGTSMDQWDPGKRDEGGASLYGSLYRRVQAVGGDVTGLLWYQGESDANEGAAPLYKEKFRAFIEAIRADFNDPTLPFHYVQIGRYTAPHPSTHWDAVQHAQYELAAEMDAVEVIASIDLGLDDRIHIDTPGLRILGERLAKRVLTEVYGAANYGAPPRLQQVTREENRFGRYYRLQFDVPNGGLAAPGLLHGFTIYDTDGAQHVFKQKIDPADPTAIRLWVMQFPQTAYLFHGRGLDPHCNLTDTAGFALPAFGHVVIRE